MYKFFISGILLGITLVCISTAFRQSTEPRIVLSKTGCGKLEYYAECGTKCTPSCRKFHTDCEECVSGCFCRKPYLRSFMEGPCIRICPLKVSRLITPHRQPKNKTKFKTIHPRLMGVLRMNLNVNYEEFNSTNEHQTSSTKQMKQEDSGPNYEYDYEYN